MRQLVSKIKYTQSYTEILEYIQFTFPEKFTLMEGNKSTFQFVSKWDNAYALNFENLLKTSEAMERFLDIEDRNYSCINLAYTQVFNAISDELKTL